MQAVAGMGRPFIDNLAGMAASGSKDAAIPEGPAERGHEMSPAWEVAGLRGRSAGGWGAPEGLRPRVLPSFWKDSYLWQYRRRIHDHHLKAYLEYGINLREMA